MNHILIRQELENKVFIAEKIGGKLKERKNVTMSFNAIVIQSFRESKIIKNEVGESFKITIEKQDRKMHESLYGITERGGAYSPM